LLGVHNSEEYKLYVRADGRVGIGTNEPDEELHILAPAQPYLKIEATDASESGVLLSRQSSNKWRIINRPDQSDSLAIQGNGALIDQFVTITQGGDVGIGTTNPSSRLEIFGDSESLKFTRDEGDRSAELLYDGSAFLIKAPTGDRLSIADVSSNELLTVNPNTGNVGIGTTTPIVPLHIKGNVVTEEQMLGGSGAGMLILETIETQPEGSDVGRLTIGTLPYKQNSNGNWVEGNSFIAARTADLLLQPAAGNVGIGVTETRSFRLDVEGRSHFGNDADHSAVTIAQRRNTSNAGLFGDGTSLAGFQGSLNLWGSNNIAESDPGGLEGCLVGEFVSLDFTAAYASNSTTAAGWTCGRVGMIFEGLTQYQSGQPTSQNRATSMAFAVSTPGGTIEERMRIRADGQHVYKATNSSSEDMWCMRRGFNINPNVRRRVRLILSNYEAVYVRIAAQRTNSGDSMVWYHGYFSNNHDTAYTSVIDSRLSSGTINITAQSSMNGGQAYYDFDFNQSASGAAGSIVVESVKGNATVQVTTY
jgi:hypothetical protein